METAWLRPRLGRRAERPICSAIGAALSLMIGVALIGQFGLADTGLRAADCAAASAHRLAAG